LSLQSNRATVPQGAGENALLPWGVHRRRFVGRVLVKIALGVALSVSRLHPAAEAGDASVTSIYTSLITLGLCQTMEVTDARTGPRHRCPGVDGYTLIVEDTDARMSVTVVTPNGASYPLDYWHLVTTHFSNLGDRAEWRVTARNGGIREPIALIIRVNSYEIDGSNKPTSYLAVAKITADLICVTDRIGPGPTANVEARRAADSSASKACLRS
jgi:hypothetical protein